MGEHVSLGLLQDIGGVNPVLAGRKAFLRVVEHAGRLGLEQAIPDHLGQDFIRVLGHRAIRQFHIGIAGHGHVVLREMIEVQEVQQLQQLRLAEMPVIALAEEAEDGLMVLLPIDAIHARRSLSVASDLAGREAAERVAL